MQPQRRAWIDSWEVPTIVLEQPPSPPPPPPTRWERFVSWLRWLWSDRLA